MQIIPGPQTKFYNTGRGDHVSGHSLVSLLNITVKILHENCFLATYSVYVTCCSLETQTFSTMVSCIPVNNITQETTVPSRRKIVYTILVDVELRHDGQHAQQQLAAAGQQQQAN